jgi:hypothetical protein
MPAALPRVENHTGINSEMFQPAEDNMKLFLKRRHRQFRVQRHPKAVADPFQPRRRWFLMGHLHCTVTIVKISNARTDSLAESRQYYSIHFQTEGPRIVKADFCVKG